MWKYMHANGCSYPPEKLQDVYRNENKDGTGDVVILNATGRILRISTTRRSLVSSTFKTPKMPGGYSKSWLDKILKQLVGKKSENLKKDQSCVRSSLAGENTSMTSVSLNTGTTIEINCFSFITYSFNSPEADEGLIPRPWG